jgi:hypothetical protein
MVKTLVSLISGHASYRPPVFEVTTYRFYCQDDTIVLLIRNTMLRCIEHSLSLQKNVNPPCTYIHVYLQYVCAAVRGDDRLSTQWGPSWLIIFYSMLVYSAFSYDVLAV